MPNQTMSKKKKQRKRSGRQYLGRKILRTLSAAAETLDSFGNFAYNPYPYLYSSLGHVYDKGTIDDAVNNLVEKGLVERDKTEGLRLTSTGAEVEKRLMKARKEEWDGKWRVVIFDIPEAQRKVRDGLRFELKRLDFGLWQRSAWVTPFNIAKELNSYLQKQNLSAVVQIVVGERFGGPGDQEFAAQVWPSLDKINERYKYLLDVWKEEVKSESTAEERLEAAVSLHDRYLDVLADDPQLPSRLLPGDWAGSDAAKLFKKLKSILAGGKAF